MARIVRTVPILLLIVMFAFPVAEAAGIGELFNDAYTAFHGLRKNPERAKYRSHWQQAEARFSAVLKRDPSGAYAPKSLYYQGRIYEEMGAISYLSADFVKAVDYFDRVVSRFPDHAWADDCLYRAAVIKRDRLKRTSQAYADLKRIVREYPSGDMRAGAEKMLAEMDAKAAANGDASHAPPAPKPAKQGDMAGLELVRYTSSDDYTRVVLELDSPTQYVYKFLDPIPEAGKGYRVYIDMLNTRISSEVPRNVEITDGILRGYRAAQNNAKTSRVVFDLHEHQEHKVFHLNNPFRIIVDVYSPGAGAAVDMGGTQGGKMVPGDLVEVLGLTVKTIMIDPGHGGRDQGASHNGLREKDVNLKLAKMLGALLEAKGFKVLYTRTTDVYVSLEDRTAMANMNKVDLFISLHCNANNSKKINGLEVYSLSLKSSSAAATRVAARENGVEPHQISDLQFILSDLVMNSKVEESSDLAELVQKRVVAKVRSKYSLTDHGHRHAPFYVLMGAKMPAILVETGYMTNAAEAKRLKSDTYLKYLAKGIVDGVLAYKNTIERFAQR